MIGPANPAAALHTECIGCRESADPLTGQEAALTLLAMLEGGHSLNEVVQGLCFLHRRNVQIAADAVREGLRR
jgi:hypothetical protein